MKCTVQEVKSPVKISSIYIYDVKFLALLGVPYIYDISRLRVNVHPIAFHGPGKIWMTGFGLQAETGIVLIVTEL
jgi:hypothetical protein